MKNDLSKILDDGVVRPLLPLYGNSCRRTAEVSAAACCALGENDAAGIAVCGNSCRVNRQFLPLCDYGCCVFYQRVRAISA
jgi:hypothetical protein